MLNTGLKGPDVASITPGRTESRRNRQDEELTRKGAETRREFFGIGVKQFLPRLVYANIRPEWSEQDAFLISSGP